MTARRASQGPGWSPAAWIVLVLAGVLALAGVSLARSSPAPVEALDRNIAMSALVEACGTLAQDRFPVSPCGRVPIFTDTNVEADSVLMGYIERAQARIGQPSFVLPRDFFSLSAGEQLFVLGNLLRLANGVPPVRYFAGGWLLQTVRYAVRHGTDPTDETGAADGRPYWESGYGSNWFSGSSPLLAFAMWAYDDGPGSTNVACTPRHPSGCWGHRRVLLWDPPGAALHLFSAYCGARAGCASKIVEAVPGDFLWGPGAMTAGRLSAQPVLFTWSDAVRAGAKLAPPGSSPPLPPPPVVSARVSFTAGVAGERIDGRAMPPAPLYPPRVTLRLSRASVVVTTTVARTPSPPLPAPFQRDGVLLVSVRQFVAALGTTWSLSAGGLLRFYGARGPVTLNLSRHGVLRDGQWFAGAARLGALAGARVTTRPGGVELTFGPGA